MLSYSYMTKQCPISGKTSVVGGSYSNRTRATKYNPTGKNRKHINAHKKRIFVPALGKHVSVIITAKGLRILKKVGVEKGLRNAGVIK